MSVSAELATLMWLNWSQPN